MTMLKDRTEVRAPEVAPKEHPPVRRRSRKAIMGWAFLAFVVLAGAVALSIWLINRDGVSEPVVTTPVLSEMVTGDALLLELPAEQGVARPPIPESGDAYFLETIARRSAQTLIELPSGEMLDVVTPLDGFPSLGPSPETGDAQVLEWLTR